MEADAELRAFLRRDEHLAPTGFVTRVISACRNNQELRSDGHHHPAPITTIEQLKNSSWHYWHNVGKKSVEHLRYLFEKNWEDSTSAVAVDGTCKWCGGTHRGMCPRVRTIEYYETGTVKRVEFITASLSKREQPSMTTANEFHKALADAGLQYSGLSWSGFAVFGDERSIAEVKRLQHLAGMVPDLQKQLPKLTVAEVSDAGVTVNWDEGGRGRGNDERTTEPRHECNGRVTAQTSLSVTASVPDA